MPKKFWQFRNQAAGSAELLLYGDISDSSWWGDEVTPKTFADERRTELTHLEGEIDIEDLIQSDDMAAALGASFR